MTEPRKKIWRRKHRWQGASWTPKNASADLGDGAWCRFHRTRHGYSRMGITYQRDSKGKWQILWSCPETKEVLETMALGGSDA